MYNGFGDIMIKNSRLLKRFEKAEVKRDKISFKKAVKIFEALWKEARSLGAIRKEDRLEGIEKEIRIAKIVNGL